MKGFDKAGLLKAAEHIRDCERFDFAAVSQHEDSEAQRIASAVLDEIKHSPELAMEIGGLLIEYAERDIAEALAYREVMDAESDC